VVDVLRDSNLDVIMNKAKVVLIDICLGVSFVVIESSGTF
jgi:hypothetical protein